MLDSKLKNELEEIFMKYKEVDKVLLFGSRARGDHKINSDVDLCIFGDDVTHLILAKIYMDLYEIDTPLSFDIVQFTELSKKELIKNILSEGVVIYNGEKA
ncbi:nucleotidyltransferase domain protein [Clostridium tepidiprofundi DSM 19306]|uniref:Nucleotidyltransferase domain protein n=1 Tax=Clostridium tepidiprofundi DSM 19306 TaxID=1121338 RepID=A0A151B519_9CLOT|nr:nucleotidyltransferase domain-containing protein [Clostridium tepidiprofundi]KYH34986.1 nucleotidyltransferase domain protein [Clostridium tepidiprofundi DSM 19306]